MIVDINAPDVFSIPKKIAPMISNTTERTKMIKEGLIPVTALIIMAMPLVPPVTISVGNCSKLK